MVRVSPDVFDALEHSFGPERGSNGEPSLHDFLTTDLTRIVDRIAADFDELPHLIPGRLDYRILIGSGLLVRAFAAIAQLRTDGSIDLLRLDLDLSWE